MTVERRWRNAPWFVADQEGKMYTDGSQLAVLMDIRDELQALNRLLNCYNFTNIPLTLREIRTATRKTARNTEKKTKRR